MALLRCDFFSEVLEVGTSMTVLLPQEGTGDGFPVLYLLHGLSDDSSAWLRFSSIERYAAELGLAVVMPEVGRSFYADEAHGGRYWTFLSEELPTIVESFFQVSDRREDTFVAGLSMGGYGALKWGLRSPERFAAVASLCGAVDLVGMSPLPERRALFDRVFDGPIAPDDDLFELVERDTSEAFPSLYVGCGTEDALYDGNVGFVDAATAAGLDVHVDFRPGAHEWALWDAMICDVLAWLPLAR